MLLLFCLFLLLSSTFCCRKEEEERGDDEMLKSSLDAMVSSMRATDNAGGLTRHIFGPAGAGNSGHVHA